MYLCSVTIDDMFYLRSSSIVMKYLPFYWTLFTGLMNCKMFCKANFIVFFYVFCNVAILHILTFFRNNVYFHIPQFSIFLKISPNRCPKNSEVILVITDVHFGTLQCPAN